METITKGAFPLRRSTSLMLLRSKVGRELHELLTSLSRCLREGHEAVAFDPESTMTPNQAASRLGMSRSHLYRFLDSGEVPFNRVGRDRRIRFADLIAFEKQRQSDRRELAERFAREAAIGDSWSGRVPRVF